MNILNDLSSTDSMKLLIHFAWAIIFGLLAVLILAGVVRTAMNVTDGVMSAWWLLAVPPMFVVANRSINKAKYNYRMSIGAGHER